MSANATILEAHDVSYAAGRSLLVANVSLHLEAGRLTIAIGPNGAGKSTLLKVMTGELRCSKGIVRYGDTDLRLLPPWRLAARRAVMAQATHLAFDFPVYEVVRLGIDGIGRKMPHAVRERMIAEALACAEVFHLAGRTYHALSGGEQQRVQFARALCQILAGRSMNLGQALFLDEPTAHLDISHQLMLMDHARELARMGVAVFVTMHDLNLAAAYADHLLVLKSGQLVVHGHPADVLTNELVAAVFGVAAGIGEQPPAGTPFFLPHLHAARRQGTN